jgi:hypothetical protein
MPRSGASSRGFCMWMNQYLITINGPMSRRPKSYNGASGHQQGHVKPSAAITSGNSFLHGLVAGCGWRHCSARHRSPHLDCRNCIWVLLHAAYHDDPDYDRVPVLAEFESRTYGPISCMGNFYPPTSEWCHLRVKNKLPLQFWVLLLLIWRDSKSVIMTSKVSTDQCNTRHVDTAPVFLDRQTWR